MTGPARILILEDDETLRAVIERVLKRQGYQVVAAARGEEAIERARGERFDLIVADIRMDGLNGLDAIEQTQQLQPDIGSIAGGGRYDELIGMFSGRSIPAVGVSLGLDTPKMTPSGVPPNRIHRASGRGERARRFLAEY